MFALPRPGDADLRALIGDAKVGLRRSRWPRLILTVVVGLAMGWWLTGIYNDANDAREEWQTEFTGYVVAHDLEAGTTLAEGDMIASRLLLAGTPRDATLRNPIGQTLRDSMAAGEVIRDGRLTATASKLAAQLGGTSSGLTIANDGTPLTEGDIVDIYGLLNGGKLANGSRVLSVGEDTITLAIQNSQLGGVIEALTTGGVLPVLVG